MHLALLVPGYPRDASDPFAPYWPNLVQALAESGSYERLSVFSLRYPDRRGSYACGKAAVYSAGLGDLPLRHSPALWQAIWNRMVLVHRRAPFDFIHALTLGEAGFVGALVAKRLGLPFAGHVHGGELVGLREIGYGSQLRWNERLQVMLSRRQAQVITAGSSQALRLIGRKAAYAPYGVDTSRFVPRAAGGDAAGLAAAGGGPAANRVLHVGDLNPVKDQRTLLAAFADVGADWAGATLSVVGGGRLAGALRRAAAVLGVEGRVRWLGRVPNGRVAPFFQLARVYVALSLHESQGVALAEAAAAGLPIVSTPVGMAPDLPPEGLRLVPKGDAASAAAALSALFASPGAAAEAGAANREAALASFSWPVCAGRWQRIHASLR